MSMADSPNAGDKEKIKKRIIDMICDHLLKYGTTVVDIWLTKHYTPEEITKLISDQLGKKPNIELVVTDNNNRNIQPIFSANSKRPATDTSYYVVSIAD